MLRRRLQIFDAAYVSALETGDEPARNGCASTAAFLRLQLRLSPGEAKRRVVAAQACSTREEFAVGVLPPHCPSLAAAQAAGVVSAEHSAVIIAALDKVPGPGVRRGRRGDGGPPGGRGRRLRAGRRGPDRPSDPRPHRPGRHPSGQRLAATDQERVAHPQPRRHRHSARAADHGGAGDPADRARATGQAGADRRRTARIRAPRNSACTTGSAISASGSSSSGDLPASGGTPATVVIHMTAADYAARTGLAMTDHGNMLPVEHCPRPWPTRR